MASFLLFKKNNQTIFTLLFYQIVHISFDFAEKT